MWLSLKYPQPPDWFMHLTGSSGDEKDHQGKASRVVKCVKRQAEEEDEVEKKGDAVGGHMDKKIAHKPSICCQFLSVNVFDIIFKDYFGILWSYGIFRKDF